MELEINFWADDTSKINKKKAYSARGGYIFSRLLNNTQETPSPKSGRALVNYSISTTSEGEEKKTLRSISYSNARQISSSHNMK